MSIQRYLELARTNFSFQKPGAFYGSAGGRSPGAGLSFTGMCFFRTTVRGPLASTLLKARLTY